MPASMYAGSGLLGISLLGFLFFCRAFILVDAYVKAGVGDVANFMTILILIALFLVGIPGYWGLRLIRRAGRTARAREEGAG